MPTNDERREVAARLRAIDDTEWTHPREELRALDEALGTAQGMPYALQTTWERFADLIEPEPERTCRLVTHKHPAGGAFERDLYCSECDTLLWDSCGDPFYSLSVEEQKFCYNCGAKVVSECE